MSVTLHCLVWDTITVQPHEMNLQDGQQAFMKIKFFLHPPPPITTQYIKDFYNRTVVSRNGTGLTGETLTLMYSLTVSVFAIGGLIGSLMVGMLVTKFGR